MDNADMTALRALIDQHGLGAHTDLLLAHVKPALYLTLGAAGEGVGHTRIGGAPDLPPDFAWPTDNDGDPMTFALQINLADVPAFDGSPLPASGLLSVFVALDLGLSTPVATVHHFADAGACQRRDYRPLDINEIFEAVVPHHLHLTQGHDLPRNFSNTQQALWDAVTLGLPSAEAGAIQDTYDALTEALTPPETVAKLLGYAAGIDQDPYEDTYVAAEVNPDWLYDADARAGLDMTRALAWQHLLSVFSNVKLDLCIYDFGFLQCFLKQEDLAAQQFGGVYAAPMST